LYRSDLQGVDLSEAGFYMVGLNECDLLGSSIIDTIFTQCRMRNLDFNGVLMINSRLERCLIGQSRWEGIVGEGNEQTDCTT
jgi:uncharacterized protein YjbI with pentapeptide repeats